MPSGIIKKPITWNSDTDNALGLSKLVNQFLGTWPYECQSPFAKIRVVIAFTSQVILFMHCLREVLGPCVKPYEVMTFLGMLGPCVIVATKTAILRANQARMGMVITTVAEDWMNEKDPESRSIMKSYASFGRTSFIFVMLIAFLPSSLLVLISLPYFASNEAAINGSSDSSTVSPAVSSQATARQLPMGTGCYVAHLSSSQYASYYAFQSLQIMIAAIGNIGIDLYFLCISMHVCGQFELLKKGLEKFGAKEDSWSYQEELGTIVRRYNHLMTLATYFETVFSPIILSVLAMDTIHLGLLGLRVMFCMNEGKYARATQGVFAFTALSLQLFLYSYVGEHLSSQNETMRDAAYNCSWYDLPPMIARNIIIIIMRSGSEFRLTAGKVFQMNLNNFKVIMKTMFSYFSMLRLMLNL